MCAAVGAAASPDRAIQLLELSRLHSTEVYDRSIDVQVLRLRRKIEPDPSQPRFASRPSAASATTSMRR